VPCSILIVDDNAVVRHSLRRYIEANTVLLVCGEAENGMIAIDLVVQLSPDVVILDFQMPVMNGLETAKQIAQIAPNIVMLMYTMHDSEPLVQAAREAGIREVLSKSDNIGSHLLTALQRHGVGA
jgi:DNA-binding NarL/FixJ family response regulator